MPKWFRQTAIQFKFWLSKVWRWVIVGVLLGIVIRFSPDWLESGATAVFVRLALPGLLFVTLQVLLIPLMLICRLAASREARLARGDLIKVSRFCIGTLNRALAVSLGVICVANVDAIIEPGKTHALSLVALLLCVVIAFVLLRTLLRQVKHFGIQTRLAQKGQTE